MGIILNINEILKPYGESGKAGGEARSLDSMLNALVNRYNIPSVIAVDAMMIVMFELANGKKFKGDGSYGSKGRELFLYIKALCREMLKEKTKQTFNEMVIQPTTCLRMDCNYRTGKLKKLSRFKRFLKFLLKPRGITRL